ncbi:MAG: phosphoribosylformylglycinamidine synthase I [Candidatus Lokiarchaeota archaeon]|nr:phosphoribosylformylglycinamidine synthase I [Candidatus Harpocratesius repetitus]
MVNVCIMIGFGINSDYESQYAFELAGADIVQRVHVNDFIHKRDSLENYQILMFPGGFSFGDYLGAGTVLANKFKYTLRKDLNQFIEDGKLIFGVCNGFQVLVKMGILPGFQGELFKQTVSLIGNKSGFFEDRWVKLKTLKSRCIWTRDYAPILEIPVRHGEGRFVAKSKSIIDQLWEKGMIPFVYDPNEYPNNPNGSTDGIAGICDETGQVFGMMPHPECHLTKFNHPQWTRGNAPEENGLKIFQNAVKYAQNHL